METHHHTDHETDNDAALADVLDLDGQVLHAYWTDALAWVQDAADDHQRILDLGAGSGTGTIALAHRFPDAEIIAVDNSEEMLSRIRTKAIDLGRTAQIHTMRADLDVSWPAIDPVDLTWASMSLHHFAQPDRVLADVFATTRPGGLIAVAEFAEPLRFLPDDIGIGRPGLERRCLDALKTEHAHSVPELGSEWAPRLKAAGFAGLSERVFAIELDPPHSPTTGRYAQLWMERLRAGLADRIAPDDRDTLDTLVGGDGAESLLRRGDLRIRGSRTVTLAQRT